jgi:NTP pyrophosphatase (non-canonical NTP hydrolase)
MSSLKDLQSKIIKFRDERNWRQFHKPKDLALSLVLEAAEVLEHFQWKDEEEVCDYIKDHKEDIGDEMGDVLAYLFQLADSLDIDLEQAFLLKLEKSAKKYPVEKAKGKHTKYTEL